MCFQHYCGVVLPVPALSMWAQSDSQKLRKGKTQPNHYITAVSHLWNTSCKVSHGTCSTESSYPSWSFCDCSTWRSPQSNHLLVLAARCSDRTAWPWVPEEHEHPWSPRDAVLPSACSSAPFQPGMPAGGAAHPWPAGPKEKGFWDCSSEYSKDN